MRSIVNRVGKVVYLAILAFFLSACGGGSGNSDDEGFTGRESLAVSVTAHRRVLPPNNNVFIRFPSPSDPFTSIITVRAELEGRPVPDGTPVQLAVSRGLELGALVCPEISEVCTEFDDPDQPPNVADYQRRFRAFGGEDTNAATSGGVFTFYFVSEGGATGVATITASIFDDNTNQTISASVDITIGSGVSTGQAAEIGFEEIDTAPLYITGQNRNDAKRMRAIVLDDGGEFVPNPAGNNLRLELLAGRPNGGEKLVTRNAAGGTEEGTAVNTLTISGLAEFSLHSGSLPGTVRIAAIADRADNNVDNGIQAPVTDVDTVAISSGQIVSLSFTGPFPSAVAQRANNLPLGAADSLRSGVYFRDITVVAVDEFGNPPPPGQTITFRLIDSPLSGYPAQGHGIFDISGDDGNPQEGGDAFTTPPGGSSLAGARRNCLLVIEGQRPEQAGGRFISGVANANRVDVSQPFNQTFDTGFTVPYTVGCVPHFGNVENNPNGVAVQTDEHGVASTIMNYPITQLGRRFKLIAEANGGEAGAVLSHWYLGIPTGSALTVSPTSFPVNPGTATAQIVALRLVDGDGTPLPGEALAVEIVLTDPTEIDAAAKEARAAELKAVLEALQKQLGGTAEQVAGRLGTSCPIDDPATEDVNEGKQCTCGNLDQYNNPEPNAIALANAKTICQAEADFAAANLAALQARAIADQYDFKACATDNLAITDADAPACKQPPTLITDSLGQEQAKLIVEDMPPDGKAEFLFSTVGPEIRANTVTVTAEPPPPPAAP